MKTSYRTLDAVHQSKSSDNYKSPSISTTMDDENSRFLSFYTFPFSVATPSYELLAQAGFHYEGKDDEVECHKCLLKHSGWQKGDDPRNVHLEKSPNCRFFDEPESETSECHSEEGTVAQVSTACGEPGDRPVDRVNGHTIQENTNTSQQETYVRFQETKQSLVDTGSASATTESVAVEEKKPAGTTSATTVPTGSESTGQVAQSEVSQNEADNFVQSEEGIATVQRHNLYPTQDQRPGEEVPNTFRNNHDAISSSDNTRSDTRSDTEAQGSLATLRPRFPKYAILANRLSSYKHWPKRLKQRPLDLAKAGLYYEGTNDYVRCFHCAGGLRDWDPEDEPFIEHARWFPFCAFMRLIKGDQFIVGVQSGTIKPTAQQPQAEKDIMDKNSTVDLLDHPAVLSIMEMGYSKEIMTKAITVFRKKKGETSGLCAEKLLPIVWDIEENGDAICEEIEEIEVNDREEGTEQDTTTHDNDNVTEITESGPSGDTKCLEDLREENRELKEHKTCKVCLDEEASIVFLPCSHLVTCPMCASSLRKCPVCRTYIRGTVKAILS